MDHVWCRALTRHSHLIFSCLLFPVAPHHGISSSQLAALGVGTFARGARVPGGLWAWRRTEPQPKWWPWCSSAGLGTPAWPWRSHPGAGLYPRGTRGQRGACIARSSGRTSVHSRVSIPPPLTGWYRTMAKPAVGSARRGVGHGHREREGMQKFWVWIRGDLCHHQLAPCSQLLLH